MSQTAIGTRPILGLKIIKDGIAVRNNPEPFADIIYTTAKGDSIYISDKIEKNDRVFYKVLYKGKDGNGFGYISDIWLENFTIELKKFNNYYQKRKQDSIYKAVMIQDSINSIAFRKYDSIAKIEKRKTDSIKKITLIKENNEIDSIYEIKQAKIAAIKKKGVPLMFTGISVYDNSIGTPQVSIGVENISGKIIDAYTVKIYCYNNFNEPVYWLGTNIFSGISQDEIKYDSKDAWSLVGFDNTTKVIAYLSKVHFTDNTTWYATSLELMSIKSY